MLRYIVAVFFTALPLALQCTSWRCVVQYGLEILTIGGWNPQLVPESSRLPLFFLFFVCVCVGVTSYMHILGVELDVRVSQI